MYLRIEILIINKPLQITTVYSLDTRFGSPEGLEISWAKKTIVIILY